MFFNSRRSTIHATHGMVATSQPLAAMAGLRVLMDGGNAVDAAVGNGGDAERGGADVHRGRRRRVRADLESGGQKRSRAERQRPRAESRFDRRPARQGPQPDPSIRPAVHLGSRNRARMGGAAGERRDDEPGRYAGAGHRLRGERFPGKRHHRVPVAATGRQGWRRCHRGKSCW